MIPGPFQRATLADNSKRQRAKLTITLSHKKKAWRFVDVLRLSKQRESYGLWMKSFYDGELLQHSTVVKPKRV